MKFSLIIVTFYLLIINVVDTDAQHACRVGQKCTAVFDILAKSIQYGVFGFTFTDFRQFCA